jgi:hypothetical protein
MDCLKSLCKSRIGVEFYFKDDIEYDILRKKLNVKEDMTI